MFLNKGYDPTLEIIRIEEKLQKVLFHNTNVVYCNKINSWYYGF